MNSTCFHSLLPFIVLTNDKKPEGMVMMTMKKKKYNKRFCHREGMINTLKPCKRLRNTAAIAALKTFPMPPMTVAATANRMRDNER
jgi:hypothetical protein